MRLPLVPETANWCFPLCSKFPVIANQSADWCGNPPFEWNQVTITTKKRDDLILPGIFRYISPLTRGLPHHLSALVRNDSIYSTNTNLSVIFAKRIRILCFAAKHRSRNYFIEPEPSNRAGGQPPARFLLNHHCHCRHHSETRVILSKALLNLWSLASGYIPLGRQGEALTQIATGITGKR